MKKISLTQAQFALVDDDDFLIMSTFKWYAIKRGSPAAIRWYAVRHTKRSGGFQKTISMHRLIMHAGLNQQIDHIDRNGLNNQKSNLRFCTPSQNLANSKPHTGNKTGYKGIRWENTRNKWSVRIQVEKKQIFLGYFESLETAREIYKKAALKYFGQFARWC